MLSNIKDVFKHREPNPFVDFRADVEKERQAEVERIAHTVGMSENSHVINFKNKALHQSAEHRRVLQESDSQRLFENNTYYNPYAMQICAKKKGFTPEQISEMVDFKKHVTEHFKATMGAPKRGMGDPKVEDVIPKHYFSRSYMKHLVRFSS